MTDKLTLKQWPMSKTSPETKLTVEGSLIESDGPPSIVFRSSAAQINNAAQTERAAVAAWLRRIGKPQLADAIEREEHLK